MIALYHLLVRMVVAMGGEILTNEASMAPGTRRAITVAKWAIESLIAFMKSDPRMSVMV